MDEEGRRPLKKLKQHPLVCEQDVAATSIQAYFRGFRCRVKLRRWIYLTDNVSSDCSMNNDVGAFIHLTPLNSFEHSRLRIG